MGKTVYSKDYRAFLEKLKNARIEANFTQVNAAKRLKKPQSYVSKIESGERRVDVVELQQLAKLYRKSFSFFDLSKK